MKLTKSLLESLIREAMEEANCRGNELGEMNCGSKRDDDTLEEEEGLLEKKLSSKQKEIAEKAPPEDKITGADFKKLRKNKK